MRENSYGTSEAIPPSSLNSGRFRKKLASFGRESGRGTSLDFLLRIKTVFVLKLCMKNVPHKYVCFFYRRDQMYGSRCFSEARQSLPLRKNGLPLVSDIVKR